jgi:hypothetical protein
MPAAACQCCVVQQVACVTSQYSSSFSCICICITNNFFALTDTAASASVILLQHLNTDVQSPSKGKGIWPAQCTCCLSETSTTGHAAGSTLLTQAPCQLIEAFKVGDCLV